MEDTWNTTLITISRLAANGYAINLNKCEFLTKSAKLLGFKVWDRRYQLGKKALTKLFTSTIPNTYKQLQQVLGRCNFASRLIPDYKSTIKPIEKLLQRQTESKWSPECTASLNTIFAKAADLLWLQIYTPSAPMFLYYSHDDETAEITLT